MKFIGMVFIVFGFLDLFGSFAGLDVWGEWIGVNLPETIWRFSSMVEIGAGFLLFNLSPSNVGIAGRDATDPDTSEYPQDDTPIPNNTEDATQPNEDLARTPCPNCGTKVRKKTTFCQECGASLNPENTTQQGQQSQTELPQQQIGKSKTSIPLFTSTRKELRGSGDNESVEQEIVKTNRVEKREKNNRFKTQDIIGATLFAIGLLLLWMNSGGYPQIFGAQASYTLGLSLGPYLLALLICWPTGLLRKIDKTTIYAISFIGVAIFHFLSANYQPEAFPKSDTNIARTTSEHNPIEPSDTEERHAIVTPPHTNIIPTSGRRFTGKSGVYSIYYDKTKWKKVDNDGTDAELVLEYYTGIGFGALIYEHDTIIPLQVLKTIVITNAKTEASNVQIIEEKTKEVGGIKTLVLKINMTIDGIPHTSLGYYLSGRFGTLQFVTTSNSLVFNDVEKDFNNLLSSLKLIDK